MIHSENNVGFSSVRLAFRLSSWTMFYAQLPFPLMTSTNVQGFKARGKAFGIVVTVLLSSRLHPIPSPRESIWHCLLSLSSRLHLIPSPRESIWHCCDNVAVFPSTPDSKPGGKALRALLCPHSFPPFFLFIF